MLYQINSPPPPPLTQTEPELHTILQLAHPALPGHVGQVLRGAEGAGSQGLGLRLRGHLRDPAARQRGGVHLPLRPAAPPLQRRLARLAQRVTLRPALRSFVGLKSSVVYPLFPVFFCFFLLLGFLSFRFQRGRDYSELQILDVQRSV